MTAFLDKLSNLKIESSYGLGMIRSQTKFYQTNVKKLEDDGSIRVEALGDKIQELRNETFAKISHHVKSIQGASKYALAVKDRTQSKAFLLSKLSFPNGSTERLATAIELKTMPADLVRMHLQDAVEASNGAMVYQILLVHGERRNEPGFAQTVDIAAAMDTVKVPGQAAALADIATIVADLREAEICVGEISGRNVSNEKLNIGRMRAEANALADAAQAA